MSKGNKGFPTSNQRFLLYIRKSAKTSLNSNLESLLKLVQRTLDYTLGEGGEEGGEERRGGGRKLEGRC
jgi:hypothetical protein